jgi:hypothetical protein
MLIINTLRVVIVFFRKNIRKITWIETKRALHLHQQVAS